MTDLILAILHHLAVFALVGTMIVTRMLLSGPEVDVTRVARFDAGAGGLSTLVVIVGVCRGLLGGKGWAFYEANPFFWAKIASFLIIGLLTLPGTVAFLRWKKAEAADPAFRPDPARMAALRRLTGWQLLMLVPLLACAAAMARWPF